MDSESLRSDSSSELGSTAVPSYLTSLTAAQRASLVELKRLCETQHVYWYTGKAGANDDVTLLYGARFLSNNTANGVRRYLRARDYRVQAAFEQYSATIAWRQKLHLDDLYLNADISHFESTSRLVGSIPLTTLLTDILVPIMDRSPLPRRCPLIRLPHPQSLPTRSPSFDQVRSQPDERLPPRRILVSVRTAAMRTPAFRRSHAVSDAHHRPKRGRR